MNCKEHHLPELELSTFQVREALQCLLHTILFLRAPGPVAPRDVHCEEFDITYTRIASVASQQQPHHQTHHGAAGAAHRGTGGATTAAAQQQQPPPPAPPSSVDRDVDLKVDASIESFLHSLTPIGPELLQGFLTLSFFERRASKLRLFGLGLNSHEEKVTWERWIVSVVVNTTPRPVNPDDFASEIERQRLQDTAEGMLRGCLQRILEVGGGGEVEHIPPVMYEFEIGCTGKRGVAAKDDRESVRTRVTNMPSLIHLGS